MSDTPQINSRQRKTRFVDEAPAAAPVDNVVEFPKINLRDLREVWDVMKKDIEDGTIRWVKNDET